MVKTYTVAIGLERVLSMQLKFGLLGLLHFAKKSDKLLCLLPPLLLDNLDIIFQTKCLTSFIIFCAENKI